MPAPIVRSRLLPEYLTFVSYATFYFIGMIPCSEAPTGALVYKLKGIINTNVMYPEKELYCKCVTVATNNDNFYCYLIFLFFPFFFWFLGDHKEQNSHNSIINVVKIVCLKSTEVMLASMLFNSSTMFSFQQIKCPPPPPCKLVLPSNMRILLHC